LLGSILFTPVQNQLKQVSTMANARTVENKIDKLVYNPANDLTAQGGVALYVLQKVPMAFRQP
jgi:ferric enterobactin receptor